MGFTVIIIIIAVNVIAVWLGNLLLGGAEKAGGAAGETDSPTPLGGRPQAGTVESAPRTRGTPDLAGSRAEPAPARPAEIGSIRVA